MKFLTDQHVNVLGHKVPLALLGVIATVGAALLLIRSSRNANAQAAVQQQASGPGVFGGASGTDVSGTLQNLQSQIAGFSSGLAQLQSASTLPGAPSQPGLVSTPPAPSSIPVYSGGSGGLGPSLAGIAKGIIPGPTPPPPPPPGPTPPQAYVPPTSMARITIPPQVWSPPWAPDWLKTAAAKPTIFTTPYVTAPALNQMNDVSAYGRGN